MSIKYTLKPLNVQDKSRAYYPIVVLTGRINFNAFLADMAAANTSFSYADVVGMTHLLMERLAYFVTHGFSVTLPLFTVRPVGQGEITPHTTSTVLSVDAKFQAGKMLRNAMSKVTMERAPTGAPDRPEPLFLLDD